MTTSTSDNNDYPNACEQAATNDELFKTFKQNSHYTPILEHVDYQQGLLYFEQFRNNKNILDAIDNFKINDKLGSPTCYNFPTIGTFSPTTLRYVKTLHDLSQLDLNDKKIVEIGPGYGGQYTTIRQMFKPQSYTFVDLSSPLKLIKKYVTQLQLDDIPLNYLTHDALPKFLDNDLVISNYAFSECVTDIQDLYISKIIEHSKHGYMIYNNMTGYSHTEFIQKCTKKIKIFDEVPNTGPYNVMLTW